MARSRANTVTSLDPEKVAYWYFRLNGFLQIVNVVVHSERRWSAHGRRRTAKVVRTTDGWPVGLRHRS
jgi:hypothetical protein